MIDWFVGKLRSQEVELEHLPDDAYLEWSEGELWLVLTGSWGGGRFNRGRVSVKEGHLVALSKILKERYQ